MTFKRFAVFSVVTAYAGTAGAADPEPGKASLPAIPEGTLARPADDVWYGDKFPALIKRCEAGDSQSCSQAARIHVEQDPTVAKSDGGRLRALLARACDGGFGEACESLGSYWRGLADTAQALPWYQKACALHVEEDCAAAKSMEAELAAKTPVGYEPRLEPRDMLGDAASVKLAVDGDRLFVHALYGEGTPTAKFRVLDKPGQAWRDLGPSCQVPLDAVAVAGDLIVGLESKPRAGFALRSHDGGKTCQEEKLAVKATPRDLEVAAGVFFLALEDGEVLTSRDGAKWSPLWALYPGDKVTLRMLEDSTLYIRVKHKDEPTPRILRMNPNGEPGQRWTEQQPRADFAVREADGRTEIATAGTIDWQPLPAATHHIGYDGTVTLLVNGPILVVPHIDHPAVSRDGGRSWEPLNVPRGVILLRGGHWYLWAENNALVELFFDAVR